MYKVLNHKTKTSESLAVGKTSFFFKFDFTKTNKNQILKRRVYKCAD